ncbi:MAG: 2Fe-2S iron-sulfur cluster-binding protein, partial [Pseudomonadota bacterium]
MSDPLVIFTPSGKRGHVSTGTTVLEAARDLGVDLDSVCGGRGICSKCQVTPGQGDFPKHGVHVSDTALSPWNAVEARYDEKRGLAPGRRLGCQAQICSDVVIDVPPESQVHRQVVRKRAEARDITLNPAVRLYYVAVAEPDMHDPTGDFERLAAALESQWQITGVTLDLPTLAGLQRVLREGQWTVTVAVHQRPSGPARILRLWPGFYDGALYGLAIDLGSTTIAAHLSNLATGEVLASSGIMNPQIRYGEDLMSRVSYAMMNADGAATMTAAVRDGIKTLSESIAADAGIETDLILDGVIVCNPVMHHLLIGVDPYELGQAPFALATSDALDVAACDLSLGWHPSARVYLLPCVAGHVGADAAAVTLSEAPDKSDDLVLVVHHRIAHDHPVEDQVGLNACVSGNAFAQGFDAV